MNKSDIRSLVKEEIKNIIQETEKDYTVEYWFRRNDDMDFDHITVKASSPTEALSKAKEQIRNSGQKIARTVQYDKMKVLDEIKINPPGLIKIKYKKGQYYPIESNLPGFLGSRLSNSDYLGWHFYLGEESKGCDIVGDYLKNKNIPFKVINSYYTQTPLFIEINKKYSQILNG